MLRRLVVVLTFLVVLAGPAASLGIAAQPASAAAMGKCSPDHGRRLVWHGGRVSSEGLVTIVYWGSWWKKHGTAAKAEINGLYRDLEGSSWAAALSQYCDRDGPPTKITPGLSLAPIDPSNPPKAPTERQISAVVKKYCCNFDLTGNVVVVTPPGSTPAFDKGLTCGHHSFTTVSNDGGSFSLAWIDLPYGHIQATHGCGWGLKQGVAGALSVVAGHEWAEAITDPFPNSSVKAGLGTGWATAQKKGMREQEVADVCEPVAHHANQGKVFLLKLKTGTFLMQKLWSNEASKTGKCVQSS